MRTHNPAALDRACVDLVYAAPDSASLRVRMERQNRIHALEHGEEIGLGRRAWVHGGRLKFIWNYQKAEGGPDFL